MTTDSPVIIEVRGLRTQFGRHVVHENLDLTVRQGEIMALIGGSGSGKTTLVRQIIGLDRPAAGTVQVFGVDINQADSLRLMSLRTRWAMMFQHGALFSALTVFDNVALPLREFHTLPEDLIRDAVLLKLQMVGLSPSDATKMPSDLSGGMLKRAALARALALEPELLFLDEPTAGLDPSLSDSFVELIQSLHHTLRLTVVMITHDLDTIFALAKQIAVLSDQRVIAKGTPAEVIAVDHPFIKDYFMGSRGMRAQQAMHTTN